MRKSTYLLSVAGALCAFALPAIAADWDHIADIRIADYPELQTHQVHFAAPVNALSFRSSGAVDCSSIEATSTDGWRDVVFSGTLDNGQRVVDLGAPGPDIRTITFNCRSLDGPAANIEVAADTDAPATVIRERVVEAPPVIVHERVEPAPTTVYEEDTVEVPREFLGLGHQWYSPVSQPKRFYIGGNHVSSISIKPTRADAVCYQGVAILDNGDARAIDVDDVTQLNRNRMYTFDLPGAPDVREVQLDCRAKNGSTVAINLYADLDAPLG